MRYIFRNNKLSALFGREELHRKVLDYLEADGDFETYGFINSMSTKELYEEQKKGHPLINGLLEEVVHSIIPVDFDISLC